MRSLLLVLLISVSALADTDRITSQIFFTKDSDASQQGKIRLKYEHQFHETFLKPRMALGATYWLLDDPGKSEDIQLYSLGTKLHLDKLTSAITFSFLRSNINWNPLLFDVQLKWDPSKLWHFELFTSREIVDTVTTLRSNYSVDTYGLSVDYKVLSELTLVGAAFRQRITDGNQRTGLVARVIYSPEKVKWFSTEIKAKQITADFNGTGYFSPSKVQDLLLLFGLTVSLKNWTAKLKVGPGVQQIEGAATGSASYGEFKLKGWFTDHFGMELRSLCTRAITSQVTDNYDRCEVGASFLGSW